MRRDTVLMAGGIGLACLAIWLVIAVAAETVRVLLSPLAALVIWLLP